MRIRGLQDYLCCCQRMKLGATTQSATQRTVELSFRNGKHLGSRHARCVNSMQAALVSDRDCAGPCNLISSLQTLGQFTSPGNQVKLRKRVQLRARGTMSGQRTRGTGGRRNPAPPFEETSERLPRNRSGAVSKTSYNLAFLVARSLTRTTRRHESSSTPRHASLT